MTNRQPVMGEAGYSYSHYWNQSAPKCGLKTPGGACLWPKEPGLCWCGAHSWEFLKRLHKASYGPEQAQAYFASLGWDALLIDGMMTLYSRLLARKEE